MPLPTDEKVVETGAGLVSALKGAFGTPPGFRPAHSKGVLVTGTFTPTETAKTLSKAPHFNNPSTPIIGRFSSSTGIPTLPDTDPNGNPRGFAVRFKLAETPRRVHTDIVAHSTPFFPSKTGEDFAILMQALGSGTAPEYIASHPETAAFVQAPKPTPSSFSHEKFFGVNAFKLIAANGKETYIRYRFVPDAGEDYLDEEAVKTKEPNFLYDEVPELIKKGPLVFKLLAQIAEEGDPTNDATIHWPESRKIVELGTLSFTGMSDHDAEEQRTIIFDPIPRVDGVVESDDPILQVRAAVYLISGRERRAAKPEA